MTTTTELLSDAFGRVRDSVRSVLDGVTPAILVRRLDPHANTIAWLVWHLTRIQDDHVAAAAGVDQQWTAAGWMERFGLPFEPRATGYGQDHDEVGAVRSEAGLLLAYHEAVHLATTEFLAGLSDSDLDRVVDRRFDPPVTLAVRLVSVIADDLEHAGQAAFVRGVAERL